MFPKEIKIKLEITEDKYWKASMLDNQEIFAYHFWPVTAVEILLAIIDNQTQKGIDK